MKRTTNKSKAFSEVELADAVTIHGGKAAFNADVERGVIVGVTIARAMALDALDRSEGKANKESHKKTVKAALDSLTESPDALVGAAKKYMEAGR